MSCLHRPTFGARAAALVLVGLVAMGACGDQVTEVIELPTPEGCTGDDDCASATPRCDLDLARCVACLGDDDCAGSDTPVCDAVAGRCAECVSDAQCDEEDERCSTSRGVCATPCEAEDECEDSARCDPGDGFCVECLTDADCEDGRLCGPSGCSEPEDEAGD